MSSHTSFPTHLTGTVSQLGTNQVSIPLGLASCGANIAKYTLPSKISEYSLKLFQIKNDKNTEKFFQKT